MKLYIKLDGTKIIEACPQQIAGGKEITCTAEEWQKIRDFHEVESDGTKITRTTDGGAALKERERLTTKAAEKEALRT